MIHLSKISLRTTLGLPSAYKVFCRRCSGKNPNDYKEKSNPIGKGYTTVYKFPPIKYISTFNRLKIYHTAGTVAAAPVLYILSSVGLTEPNLPFVFTYLGMIYIREAKHF